MYNYVFWFFYKYFEWKDKDDSTFIPTTLVVLCFCIHVFLGYSIYRVATHSNLLEWQTQLKYGQNKYVLILFIVIIMVIIWLLYYKKRATMIIGHYKDKKPFTVKSIFIITLIMIVPLVIAVLLTNLSV